MALKTDPFQTVSIDTTGAAGSATGRRALTATGFPYIIRVAVADDQPSTAAVQVYDAQFPDVLFLDITAADITTDDGAQSFYVTVPEHGADGAALDTRRIPFMAGRNTADLIIDVSDADPATGAVTVSVQMAGAEY